MDEETMTTPTPAVAMSHAATSSSRPTLGFPLGTALLLIVIFCLSGVFSCCYHWDKLRSLRARASRRSTDLEDSRPYNDQHATPTLPPSSPPSKIPVMHQEKEQSLPVIMPGDQIPKFMAWPRSCQHR